MAAVQSECNQLRQKTLIILVQLFHVLFHRETPTQIKARTLEAKKTLELWKECYFEVRAKIEASGRDARWEFDRKRLFERTDYMAMICQDIYDVAQVK